MSDRNIPSKDVIPEVEEAWGMVIDACQQAWPDRKPLIYSDSPTELIIEIIDERDELRAELEALKGSRVETTCSGWLPIWTAPKDGSFIVALDGIPDLAWPAHASEAHIYSNAHGVMNEPGKGPRATHWRPSLPPAPSQQVKTSSNQGESDK